MPSRKPCKSKCPDSKICNYNTGRCVSKSGKIGKSLSRSRSPKKRSRKMNSSPSKKASLSKMTAVPILAATFLNCVYENENLSDIFYTMLAKCNADDTIAIVTELIESESKIHSLLEKNRHGFKWDELFLATPHKTVCAFLLVYCPEKLDIPYLSDTLDERPGSPKWKIGMVDEHL